MTKKQKIKMELKKNEPLKLMRWRIDNFPPINLNEHFMDVVALTKEIEQLRYKLKSTNFHIEENLSVIENEYDKILEEKFGNNKEEIKKSIDDLLFCGVAIQKEDGDKIIRIDPLSEDGIKIANENVFNAENFENNKA